MKRFSKRRTNWLSILHQAIREVTPESWYSNKNKICRRINASSLYWNRIHTRKSASHSLVVKGVTKIYRSYYGFQIKFELVDTTKGVAIPYAKRKRLRMIEANKAFAYFVNRLTWSIYRHRFIDLYFSIGKESIEKKKMNIDCGSTKPSQELT